MTVVALTRKDPVALGQEVLALQRELDAIQSQLDVLKRQAEAREIVLERQLGVIR